MSKALGLNNSVQTPFLYEPRSRPAVPVPAPLSCFSNSHGFPDIPQWSRTEGKMLARMKNIQDVIAKLYLPRSRIFHMREPIPFHLTFSSSAISLAAFMPLGPAPAGVGQPTTNIRLIRRSNCDVRYVKNSPYRFITKYVSTKK